MRCPHTHGLENRPPLVCRRSSCFCESNFLHEKKGVGVGYPQLDNQYSSKGRSLPTRSRGFSSTCVSEFQSVCPWNLPKVCCLIYFIYLFSLFSFFIQLFSSQWTTLSPVLWVDFVWRCRHTDNIRKLSEITNNLQTQTGSCSNCLCLLECVVAQS